VWTGAVAKKKLLLELARAAIRQKK